MRDRLRAVCHGGVSWGPGTPVHRRPLASGPSCHHGRHDVHQVSCLDAPCTDADDSPSRDVETTERSTLTDENHVLPYRPLGQASRLQVCESWTTSWSSGVTPAACRDRPATPRRSARRPPAVLAVAPPLMEDAACSSAGPRRTWQDCRYWTCDGPRQGPTACFPFSAAAEPLLRATVAPEAEVGRHAGTRLCRASPP